MNFFVTAARSGRTLCDPDLAFEKEKGSLREGDARPLRQRPPLMGVEHQLRARPTPHRELREADEASVGRGVGLRRSWCSSPSAGGR